MEALSDVLKHARAIAQPLSTEISTDARDDEESVT
jgi:hypothetical protein